MLVGHFPNSGYERCKSSDDGDKSCINNCLSSMFFIEMMSFFQMFFFDSFIFFTENFWSEEFSDFIIYGIS